MAWLEFVVRMGLNQKIKLIAEEMHSIDLCSRATLFRWEKKFHASLSAYVKSNNIDIIGGKDEVCVVDEAAMGKLGHMCGKRAHKTGGFKRRAPRIKERLPGQTRWRVGAKSRPSGKRGTSLDKRSNV
eukprot:5928138-Amphidinium_carterae.1